MLNTLANHGFFNRNGQSIDVSTMKTVFDEQLNVGADVSDFFIGKAIGLGMGRNNNSTLSLGDISGHGQIEHDVSLVHDDLFYHGDVIKTNQTLVAQLISFSSDQETISISDLGKFRKARLQDSKERNPNLEFGLKQEFVAFGESALTISVLGEHIPITTIQSFLGEERLPIDFQRPNHHTRFTSSLTYSMPGLIVLVARVKFAAGIFSS